MDTKGYYRLLGVSPDASADKIKRAYRKAARKYHPDVNTKAEAAAMFRDVNAAYDVLKHPEKRAAYDRGDTPEHDAGFGHPPEWNGGFEFTDQSADFGDVFETLFRQGAAQRGGMGSGFTADRHAKMEIPIEDSFTGAHRDLHLRMPVVRPDGSVTIEDRALAVQIPKGIAAGQHLRLAGQSGVQAQGGTAGDLFLEITFAPHPIYHPDGRDLHMTLPVAPWEAALGGLVVLPTPAGKVELRIPPNARSGQKLRLKGKGLPGPQPGHIYAKLEIVNPTVSTDTAREVFEKMAEAMPFDPRAKLGG